MAKYRNVITEFDGIKFRSKKEAYRYKELRLLEKGRLISELKCHTPRDIIVNGIHICKYVDDFSYLDEFQQLIIEDVKGMRKGAPYSMFTLKKKLLRATTGLEIIEI